jgi:GlcNAc-PI de-N-acetylase
MQYVVISPHFDDAVGSCGGTIYRLTQAQHTVYVLTVFGGFNPVPQSTLAERSVKTYTANDLISRRRDEDASACALLKCRAAFLEFPDAVYRYNASLRPLYPTAASLSGALAHEDRNLPERIAETVSQLIDTIDVVILCPFGIGGHVDHVIVARAGYLLEKRGARVVFYRDFYYDQYIIGTAICERFTKIHLTLPEVDNKIDAVSCYSSQIECLFGTRSRMLRYFHDIGSIEGIELCRLSNALSLPDVGQLAKI